MCAFLKPFHKLTELSGEKYPTIALVNAYLPLLEAHACKQFKKLAIAEAARAFKLKLEQYICHLNCDPVMSATKLDPRIKLSFLPRSKRDEVVQNLEKYAGTDLDIH